MKTKLFLAIGMVAVVLICLIALPTEASAATSGYYTYTVANGEATITGCDTSLRGDITIPSTLGGYPVTSIGERAFYLCNMTSITIPNSVISIEDAAFFDCAMTSIVIPNSVTSIGASAFCSCFNLTNVTIPNSIISIGEYAFSGCTSLSAIWVDADNDVYSSDSHGVLYSKDQTELIQAPGTINDAYTIPNSVTSIGSRAFADCNYLTRFIIPNGVTSIGESAFSACNNLTSITIPDSVTSIDSYVFGWCDSLTDVTIGNSVTSIGSGAFAHCSSLTSVTIPDSVISIGENAFIWCTGLTSATIGNGVTSIGHAAFQYCTSLTSITIPNSVTSIGNCAFIGCTALTSVTYCGTEEQWNEISIDSGGNNNLINAPRSYHNWVDATCVAPRTCSICGVTEGEKNHHNYINGVCTICGDKIVYTITFKNWNGDVISTQICHWGDEVIAPANPTRAEDETYTYTFAGWDKEVVPCAGDATYTATYTPKRKDVFYHSVRNGQVTITGYEGVGGVLIIPDTIGGYPVTTIAEGAFAGCTNLTGATIPNSVTRIYADAFRNCTGLTSVTISNSVSLIDISTFYGCSSLTNVVIPEGVTRIRGFAFFGCGSLTEIVIPAGVVSIDECAFYGCGNLSDITIPDSVTAIGKYAFEGCKALANVTYCGTEEQWDEISIQSNNEPLANAMRSYHSYTNGECTFCGHRFVYTVTFKDWNGTVLFSQACYWGDAVTEPAAPTRAADKTYTYAFAGWNAEVVPCAGNATYTATYSKSYINYTVEFRDWNGNFISVKIYHWGDTVTAPADPVRAANETYTYAFAGWDKEVVACAGDAAYTATYSENYINYTITFQNWNGDVISLKTYHWGDAVTAPADPTRAADETYTYIFTGWDREVAACAGDAIYTATYLKQCRDAFLYTIENGQVTITDYVGSDDILLIPGFIEGLPVVGIGSSAFSESFSLTKVTIPQSVVSIGENAFNGCTSIVKVVIPDSVAAIGHSAFLGTPWYTEKIAQSGEWLIVGDGVLLKYSGTGATEVAVPASVKYISDAFRGNSKLVRIDVKSTCKTIGQYAFADCPKLKIIGLPMKLDYIASNSVVGCPILQNIKNIDDNPATPETITPIETVPPVQAKPEGVTPASVKVMSWNIWHENVWTGQCTNWERLAKVIDVVEYFNPDVLMTQETTDWWCIYLMQNLPSQYTWAYTHSNGHDEAMPELNKNNKHADETHSAIFYNQEKLELLDNGLFWLSETPNVMSKYYESWCFRIVSWAKFRDKATGREFICIDVHLDDETDEPYKILMDFVTKNIETPTILAGDFNRRSDEDIMKKLNTYTPLKDASNGTEGKSNIDWVYVSRNTVEVLSYKNTWEINVEKPSDHKPRVVELLIY